MKAKSSSNKTNLETYTARIVALGLLAACLLLALTGCQHESTANPGPDPAGAYALISVDGKTVPCTINHEGTAMTVEPKAVDVEIVAAWSSPTGNKVGDFKAGPVQPAMPAHSRGE